MNPRLYLWHDHSLLFADGHEEPVETTTLLPTLVLSSSSIVISAGGGTCEGRCFLLQPNLRVRYGANRARIAVLTLNSASAEFEALLDAYSWEQPDQGAYYLHNAPELNQRLFSLDVDGNSFLNATVVMLASLYPSGMIPIKAFDARIAEAVATLIADPANDWSAADIAARVCLSTSRFTSLFYHAIGIPFQKFKIACRLGYFFEIFQAAGNLTDAANEAGFYDLSHLNKVFRMYFAFSPRKILQESSPLEIVRDRQFDRLWYANWITAGLPVLSKDNRQIPVSEFLLSLSMHRKNLLS